MAAERPLSLPDDPRQSITWWKSHRISADKDVRVAQAEGVFQNLLRAWDNARLEPGLYVVNSTRGAWAASLADGNILLSRDAIDSCMRFGEQRGQHLLAFVLAHELAHQRADDLWHQRFFRMLDKRAEKSARQALQRLQLDEKTIASLQQKEAQADHDGLILMASVGYDPYQILDKQDFFTAWVENIQGESCRSEQDSPEGSSVASGIEQACEQARLRALRSQAQLSALATQTMLYELGVQAFVAKNYRRAREYFSAYARDYPGRAVLSALGLSYLAEAVVAHHQLMALGAIKQPAFYYPLMLDARGDAAPGHASATRTEPGQQMRSAAGGLIKKWRREKQLALQNSIKLFEKTIRLAPEHKKSYLLLAMAYLLEGNRYMVRGVLQGRYQKKFGDDAGVSLLLAMSQALDAQPAQADKAFQQLIRQQAEIKAGIKNSVENNSALSENLLLYSSYYNYAALLRFSGKAERARTYWKQLAQQAKKSGNSLLFRLALAQLTHKGGALSSGSSPHEPLLQAPTINGYRPGDMIKAEDTGKFKAGSRKVDDLWIDGELHQVYRLDNGSRFITDARGKIISAWQDMGRASVAGRVRSGDAAERPFKTLGIPDRHLLMSSGEYLAYDQYGLALHLNNNKVQGWFIYIP